ncbi:unnamed protein product [Thelazia callipaeda]|uniref:WH2 domain-containing protein n=1 Tax=Thelazia callipaeda TaxID=103827 RepID=A0A0N5DB76_THECL|nr:unnamed protein product [Thelazia callipaeda]
MERFSNSTKTVLPPSVVHSSDGRNYDRNELDVDGLFDTITNEETCSLNSTSISINHSRDSILDFSICSNPIDEAAIMEEQLAAASGELLLNGNDAEVRSCARPTLALDNSAKDTRSRITCLDDNCVASTTKNNVSEMMQSILTPLHHVVPPIASLEDLTNGEQSFDITSSKSHVASSTWNQIKSFGQKSAGKSDINTAVNNSTDNNDNTDDNNYNIGKITGGNCKNNQRQTSTAIKRYILHTGMSNPPSMPPPPPPLPPLPPPLPPPPVPRPSSQSSSQRVNFMNFSKF